VLIALAKWGYNIDDSPVSEVAGGDAPIDTRAGMVSGSVSVAIGIDKIK
jgi:hypothetical protein